MTNRPTPVISSQWLIDQIAKCKAAPWSTVVLPTGTYLKLLNQAKFAVDELDQARADVALLGNFIQQHPGVEPSFSTPGAEHGVGAIVNRNFDRFQGTAQ